MLRSQGQEVQEGNPDITFTQRSSPSREFWNCLLHGKPAEAGKKPRPPQLTSLDAEEQQLDSEFL